MKQDRILKTNLIFVLVVLAFNVLFAWQQQSGAGWSYGSVDLYAQGPVFWTFLFFVSFFLCLLSLPGAGFSLSVGGYLLGLKYLPVAGLILFLSTWAAFPFANLAKSKTSFFRKFAENQVIGSSVDSIQMLSFLRMNPAVPFLFFASFYSQKLNLRSLILLFVASVFHAFIYVLVGWNMKTLKFDIKDISLFTTAFMLLTLAPVLLMSFSKKSKDI